MWVLLDSESTDHIFCNRSTYGQPLMGIFSDYTHLEVHWNPITEANFNVWYNPNCLANVLSLALVIEQFRVTMDTNVVNGFNIRISDSHIIQFTKAIPGLYLYNVSNVDLNKLRCAISFLNTVASYKSFFKKRDVRRADDALLLNCRLNHIAKYKFIRIMKDHWIRNNPLTVSDV